ncbi:MAG: hypothetical protein KJ069_15525 [Anaerolineae bacterium]|nr:hypothetical protein [Anaerolineae bacterium]
MSPLFKKLNLKEQTDIVVVNAPASFAAELAALTGVTVYHDLDAVPEVHFSLAFVTQQAELDRLVTAVTTKAAGDALIWFAYPKKSSKTYTCDFDRDTGWDALGAAGFEAVRQVAIDADWSTLRFRRAEYIKTMQRDPKRAMSATGKQRTGS